MSDEDRIYGWAETAVGTLIVEIRPDLSTRWRGVHPENVGLDVDNWLVLSRRMISLFNQALTENGIPAVSMSEPARGSYYSKALITFVTALADVAEQVA